MLSAILSADTKYWRVMLYGLVGILLVLLLFQPTHMDEHHFLTMAQLWAKGSLPYTQFSDNKPPGIYGLLVAVSPVSGWVMNNIRVVFLMMSLIGAYLIFLIGRLIGNGRFAWVGPVVYLTMLGLFHGSYAITEPPVAFLMVVTGYFLLNIQRLSGFDVLVVGILVGIMFLFKQPAISVAVAVGVAVIYLARRQKRSLFKSGLIYLAGWFLPVIGVWLYFYLNGADGLLIDSVLMSTIKTYHPLNLAETFRFVWWNVVASLVVIWVIIVYGSVKGFGRQNHLYFYLLTLVLLLPWLFYRPYHHYWVFIVPLVSLWLLDILRVHYRNIVCLYLNIAIVLVVLISYSCWGLVIIN